MSDDETEDFVSYCWWGGRDIYWKKQRWKSHRHRKTSKLSRPSA